MGLQKKIIEIENSITSEQLDKAWKIYPKGPYVLHTQKIQKNLIWPIS